MSRSDGTHRPHGRGGDGDRDDLVQQDVSAQDYNGSVRTVWPQPWARAAGVGHKTAVTAVVHVSTGAMVSLPPGLSLDEFLSEVL